MAATSYVGRSNNLRARYGRHCRPGRDLQVGGFRVPTCARGDGEIRIYKAMQANALSSTIETNGALDIPAVSAASDRNPAKEAAKTGTEIGA
jgi:hypothetical protein